MIQFCAHTYIYIYIYMYNEKKLVSLIEMYKEIIKKSKYQHFIQWNSPQHRQLAANAWRIINLALHESRITHCVVLSYFWSVSFSERTSGVY